MSQNLKTNNMYKNYIPKAVTANDTTTVGQCVLAGIYINKAMTGTLIVKDGTVVLGTIAAATPAGSYWVDPQGTSFGNLILVSNSAADDISIAVSAV